MTKEQTTEATDEVVKVVLDTATVVVLSSTASILELLYLMHVPLISFT